MSSLLCHCPHCDGGVCNPMGGKCYFFTEQVLVQNEQGKSYHESQYKHGCTHSKETGMLSCMGDKSVRRISVARMHCCDDHDLCNLNMSTNYAFPTDIWEKHHLQNGTDMAGGGASQNIMLLGIVAGAVGIFCLFLFAVLAYLVWKCGERKHDHSMDKGCKKPLFDHSQSDSPLFDGKNRMFSSINDVEQSSGSGSGLPFLQQRTIAKEIERFHEIGKGRYGVVFYGVWRGSFEVAVKSFDTIDEESWKREDEIYKTCMLSHDNILRFIASDIIGTPNGTQMLLITHYHKDGSLYDFFRIRDRRLTSHSNGLTKTQTLRFMYSIAKGLTHLHLPITSTYSKPAMAHRDLKTKNILVKADGECCIADFGLAVKKESGNDRVDIPRNGVRVGTKRYMSPEALTDTLNTQMFDSFAQADIYSFSLVLWEIATQCDVDGVKAPYKVPFEDVVPCDPSIDKMRELVCGEPAHRPAFPHNFTNDPHLAELVQLICECWKSNPSARPPILRIEKCIKSLLIQDEQDNVEILTSPMQHTRQMVDARETLLPGGVSIKGLTNASSSGRNSDMTTSVSQGSSFLGHHQQQHTALRRPSDLTQIISPPAFV